MILVPVLLLVLAPALAILARAGAFKTGYLGPEHPWIRAAAAVACGALCLLAVPLEQGYDFDALKNIKMLIAAAAALALAFERWGGPAAQRPRRRVDGLLLALACLGVANWLNYGAFHGQRTFVHLHDVAHYYLGSKYYEELGYTDLYTAMLRAEAENHGDRFRAIEARDLENYRRVHVRTLLQRSDAVKAEFTAERWFDFRRDADFFRERLPEHYGRILLDHGFNPTPIWALLGGSLAQRVPAGSERGLLMLSLLDPVFLVLSFAALGWGFGRRTAILAVLYFTVIFGATFGWVGGAFLRYPWFFGVTVGLACWRRRRYGAAGALFALAVLLRVFPLFFLLPLAARAFWVWRRSSGGEESPRLPESRYLRFGLAAGATAALLVAASVVLLPRGFGHWVEFRANMSTHLKNIAPNVVGTTEVLAHRWGERELVTQEEFDALKERRMTIHRAQQVAVFLPLCLLAALAARRRSDLGAIALALPLLLSGLSLGAYYYSFLVLLVPIFRRSEPALIALFSCEALCFALRLFEESDGRLFVYRTVALLWLAAFLLVRRRARDARI